MAEGYQGETLDWSFVPLINSNIMVARYLNNGAWCMYLEGWGEAITSMFKCNNGNSFPVRSGRQGRRGGSLV